MSDRVKSRCLRLGLLLAILATAPAPPAPPPPVQPDLAELRYKAALKQFDEVWTFYRQSRTDSFPVYYWSKLVLESQRDLGDGKAQRLAALQGHLDRMLKLEALVRRVRRLGFGFSTDVGATEYYRLEARLWIERERAR